MVTFIMLVGVPASGKSTYAAALEKKGYHVHSSDAIRKELSGSEENQECSKEAFRILHERVKRDLKNGVSCVYDATNLTSNRRAGFLREIRKYGCFKKCVAFYTSPEVCKQRNAARDRHVPEDVIDRFFRTYQAPAYSEGWDVIDTVA